MELVARAAGLAGAAFLAARFGGVFVGAGAGTGADERFWII